MSAYTEMNNRHQQEVNDFPFFFAFNDKQFEEGMAKFGLSPNDTDKIYSMSNTGGFYLRTDSPRLAEMMARHNKEFADAVAADLTGEGFIFEMFDYELANHEYGGFYLRTDSPRLHEMLNRHDKEMQDAIDADTTGEGFIFEMFDYELADHEFVVSCDVSSTLDALGLEPEDIDNDQRLQHGLKLAKKRQFERMGE